MGLAAGLHTDRSGPYPSPNRATHARAATLHIPSPSLMPSPPTLAFGPQSLNLGNDPIRWPGDGKNGLSRQEWGH